MESKSVMIRGALFAAVCATAASFGLVTAPSAFADTVEPYQSDYGNVDVFTTGDGQIGVGVSNFRLQGDPKCGVIVKKDNYISGATTTSVLPVSDDGSGQTFVGPLGGNGTYFVTLNCDNRAADGGPLGRGPWTSPTNPIFINRQSYDANHPGMMVTVHIDGKPTRPNIYGGLPTVAPGPDFNPAPLPSAPTGTPDVNDIAVNQAKGEKCADALSGSLDKLPPGTEAALEVLHKVPKDASNFAYAACALNTLANSPNPADDQDVFNSICKGLENAFDPLGIGAAKDFFCGTPVG